MDKINGEIKRVIGSGGADHCDRIDFKLYDRTGAAGHSDGFYYWSNPSDSRNDVLYTGCRDVDDTDGREDRNPDRTVKKLPVIIGLCFVLGFIITISEPDLQVLAGQVPSVSNRTLILAVAVGVGIFLVTAVLRMLFSKPLSYMLLIFYPVVFILTFFVSKDFLAIAFDSGGVTTGPMTVPFIMALGIGFSAVRSDKYAETDSFGLVSLCSIGPVLAVLLLGIIYHPQGGSYSENVIPDAETSVALWKLFESGIPHYMKEIGGSLLPIILFFAFFQVVSLKLKKKTLIKILVGILYTYIGLVLFLTGVNVGFMPVGNYLGQVIAGLPYRWVIIPIGMLIGYFIVKAEPAVYVLMEQVEELTSGAIPGKAMGYSLSLGVAFSLDWR